MFTKPQQMSIAVLRHKPRKSMRASQALWASVPRACFTLAVSNISIVLIWDIYAQRYGNVVRPNLAECEMLADTHESAGGKNSETGIGESDGAHIHSTFIHMNNGGWEGKSARKETEYGSVAICSASCVWQRCPLAPLSQRAQINRQAELSGSHTGRV